MSEFYPIVRQNVNGIGVLNDFVRQLPERLARHNASVVNENVHSAHVRFQARGGLIDLFAIGDVYDVALASQVFGRQDVDGRLESFSIK